MATILFEAKTGYSTRIEPKIGWWVGWVELDDNVVFAMNMDMPTSDGLGLRQPSQKEVLKQEKIIPLEVVSAYLCEIAVI